jgi:hypothetical protein
MGSILPSFRFRTEDDIKRMWKVIGWQSPGFNRKLWRATVSFTSMQPSDFVYFSTYALSGLVLSFSSFFFTLLEHYSL